MYALQFGNNILDISGQINEYVLAKYLQADA